MRQLKIATQITNRDSQAVEKYLQEISKIPMITPEEETTLAQRIKMGDQRALDKLVQANLRFVVSVAKQYQHQGLSLSDLINEGNLGLIKAAQRFDETKGFKFISYAVWWIRQSILQALAEQGRLVRLPQNKIGTYTAPRTTYRPDCGSPPAAGHPETPKPSVPHPGQEPPAQTHSPHLPSPEMDFSRSVPRQ